MALGENAPQPQAEKGMYFEFTGRPLRNLYGTLEFDAFRRLTDMADYRRIVLKATYRANSRLSFRIWRKWQGRGESNSLTPTAFEVDEIRFSTSAWLTGRSSIDFGILHSFMQTPPNPSYVGSADPSQYNDLGRTVDPSDGLMLGYTLNATERLSLQGQAIVYKGWLWNFENGDFSVLESDVDAVRFWVALKDRLTKNLGLTMKLSFDTPVENTGTYIRNTYDRSVNINGGTLKDTNVGWLVQLDWFF
jgi:hypothetical protein